MARVVKNEKLEKLANESKEILRLKRRKILSAYDIYKTNVLYGTLSETEQEHAEIVAWYQRLLDLEVSAFDEVPEKIRYYL